MRTIVRFVGYARETRYDESKGKEDHLIFVCRPLDSRRGIGIGETAEEAFKEAQDHFLRYETQSIFSRGCREEDIAGLLGERAPDAVELNGSAEGHRFEYYDLSNVSDIEAKVKALGKG